MDPWKGGKVEVQARRFGETAGSPANPLWFLPVGPLDTLKDVKRAVKALDCKVRYRIGQHEKFKMPTEVFVVNVPVH